MALVYADSAITIAVDSAGMNIFVGQTEINSVKSISLIKHELTGEVGVSIEVDTNFPAEKLDVVRRVLATVDWVNVR